MAKKKHREDLFLKDVGKEMSDLDFEGQDRKMLEFPWESNFAVSLSLY